MNRLHRTDPLASARRDAARLQRREPGSRSFWRSLGVLGMVGWPIALGAAGGALLGRLLDTHYSTGIRFTLIALGIGVLLGAAAAWNAVNPKT